MGDSSQPEGAVEVPWPPGAGVDCLAPEREHCALFQAIFDHAHLRVAYLDRDLRFVRVNYPYAAVEGWPPSDFVGLKHFELYPHAENEVIFRRVLETGEPHYERAKPFAYAQNPERGVSFWDWTLVPLSNPDGSVRGLILTLVDVTERVTAIRELRQLADAREALLREVHHRVKNNLQIVASLLGLQEARLEHEDAARALRESRQRVHAIALIHDEIQRAHDLERLSFGDFCESLVKQLRSAFGHGDRIAVRVQIERDVEVPVELAVPLVLILNELVTNAFTHAFTGEREGTVAITCARRDDGRVALTVEDDGVGFTKEPTEGEEETLGLRLVRNLTRQLGGELQIRLRDPTRVSVIFDPCAHDQG